MSHNKQTALTKEEYQQVANDLGLTVVRSGNGWVLE